MSSGVGAIAGNAAPEEKKTSGGMLPSILCCGTKGEAGSNYAKVADLESTLAAVSEEVLPPGQCSLQRLNFNYWFWYTWRWQESFLQSPCVSSNVLRAVRLIQAVAMVGVLIWSLQCVVEGKCRWFIYLTNQTLLIITAYLVCAAVMMFTADPTKGLAPTIVRVVWALQTIALPGSIVVALLFWVLLFPTLTTIEPIAYFTHGYTAIAMLVDFLLTRQPFYSLHTVYYLLFGTYYMLFTLGLFIAAGCLSNPYCDVDGNGNPYVYTVFDWRNPQATVITGFMALIASTIICQVLFLVSKLRGDNMGWM